MRTRCHWIAIVLKNEICPDKKRWSALDSSRDRASIGICAERSSERPAVGATNLEAADERVHRGVLLLRRRRAEQLVHVQLAVLLHKQLHLRVSILQMQSSRQMRLRLGSKQGMRSVAECTTFTRRSLCLQAFT